MTSASAARRSFQVIEDDLTRPTVVALLTEHLAGMRAISPPGSVHALDLDGLRAPSVTFWTAWAGDPGDGAPAGCAALSELTTDHGELKSFRTSPAYLGTGVGSTLLAHLIGVARARGYVRLSLETGSGPGFQAAHAFYQRHGFQPCGPFADYVDDAFSRYLSREL